MGSRANGFAASLITLSLVSGCANWTHLTRDRELETAQGAPTKAQTIIVDAKQRLITASPITTGSGNGAKTYLAFCAEPSPDALSALAAGYGISLSKEEKLSLGSSLSFAEGASSIGLRTQSIQLMRDAMYRLCEGYMSGALDALSFQTLHRRFQSSMVAILAIEQLTGAMRGPSVAIGGNAMVGKAELVADLTAKREAAALLVSQAEEDANAKKDLVDATKKKVDAAQSEFDAETDPAKKAQGSDLKKKLDDATQDHEKAEESLAAATKVLSNRKTSLNIIDQSLAQAVAGGSNASVTVDVRYPDGGTPDSSTLASVSDNVANIVTSTLNLNWGPELCVSLLLVNSTTSPPNDSATRSCKDFLDQNVKVAESGAILLTSLAQVVAKMQPADLTPDRLNAINNLAENVGNVVMMSKGFAIPDSSAKILDDLAEKAAQ